MNLYLDTNVLLDMFLDRDDGSSCILFKKAISGNDFTLFINDITVINMHYIISKYSTKENALNSVKVLRENCELVIVNEDIIDNAITSDFLDFEDAIQYYCAKQACSDYIITRNIKDFIHSKIKILTSEQWLSELPTKIT
jgi:predicted nucleic-acid-binding protein